MPHRPPLEPPFLGPMSAVRLHTHGQTGRLLPATAGAGGGGAPGAWNTGDATLAYLRQLHGSAPPSPQADARAPAVCGRMPAARPPPHEWAAAAAEALPADGANVSTAWLEMEQVLQSMQSAVREVSAASSMLAGGDFASSVRRERAPVSRCRPAVVGAAYACDQTHTAQLDALEESLDQVESGMGVSPLPVSPPASPAPPCVSHVRGRLRVLRWKWGGLTDVWFSRAGAESGAGRPRVCPREQPYARAQRNRNVGGQEVGGGERQSGAAAAECREVCSVANGFRFCSPHDLSPRLPLAITPRFFAGMKGYSPARATRQRRMRERACGNMRVCVMEGRCIAFELTCVILLLLLLLLCAAALLARSKALLAEET